MAEFTQDTLLSIKGLDLYYGQIQALRNISLKIPGGSVVAILGPNGAGKSSLLNTISGQLKPSSGIIEFLGKKINGKSPHSLVKMGMLLVPQDRGLFKEATVLENLELAPIPRQLLPERISEAFDLFPHLKKRSNQLAGTLSGGEQQMLVMTKAIMVRPVLFMVDEMSQGLAPQVLASLFDSITKLKALGTTIVLVEQYIGMALKMSDFIYVLRQGEIVLSISSSELLDATNLQDQYFGVRISSDKLPQLPDVTKLHHFFTT